ncbi:MAG: Zn-dependent hydrolase [Bacteroidetes bacterium]|nr:MAG: Zn-dependent hydrolase [Bacteroidota bacterium]
MSKKILVLLISLSIISCKKTIKDEDVSTDINKKLSEYVEVKLTSDISSLSKKEKEMLGLFIDAAKYADNIFWKQSFGNKEKLIDEIKDKDLKKFALINYGTWDRLDGNKPFIEKYGIKPVGARFYPSNMTFWEFDALNSDDKYSMYTIIRRKKDGNLVTIPYHKAYKNNVNKISEILNKAASKSENKNLKNYLQLRAKAIKTDDYLASDIAWIEMLDNNIDIIIGPIETYEDLLLGAKASYEAFVLIKDNNWTAKLKKFTNILPDLQKMLPVDAKYKKEIPEINSDICVYDLVYAAGNCNTGSKKISIVYPFVGQEGYNKGSRKLEFKNVMKAKFEKILKPISNVVIDADQLSHVKFDSFFEISMFYEVGNCLGMTNTINNRGSVKQALREKYNIANELKSNILSLFFITKLQEMGGILNDKNLMDNYITFMSDIIRSVRFGASNSQAIANLIIYNYFNEYHAFSLNKFGKYIIDFDNMKKATTDLSQKILIIQGNGDYDEASKLIEKYGKINPELQKTHDKIANAGIPVDVTFSQGKNVIGLYY